MAFIDTVPEDAADGEVAELYEEDRSSLAYVANYTRAFSHRPDVMRSWEQLSGAVRANMDLRRYELVTGSTQRSSGPREATATTAHSYGSSPTASLRPPPGSQASDGTPGDPNQLKVAGPIPYRRCGGDPVSGVSAADLATAR